MKNLQEVVDVIKGQQAVLDDGPVDRLNRIYVPGVLVGMAATLIVKEYVGEPIQCWCPAFFKDQYIKYTNRVCWVSNTYHAPISDHIPDDLTKIDVQLTYYQWTSFIILFQALLFFLPGQLWQAVHERSGLSLTNVVEGIRSMQLASKHDEKKRVLEYTTRLLDGFFVIRGKKDDGKFLKKYNNGLCLSRRGGNFLVAWYMICKTLYLINTIAQFFLLNAFLSIDYHMYGIYVVKQMLKGEIWTDSPQFPHVTLCDFKIRQPNNLHRYTVQCVLQINFFNEKIFFLIWFLILATFFITLYSFCSWLWYLSRLQQKTRYVRKHVELGLGRRLTTDERRGRLKEFVSNYLRQDGHLILHIISRNASDLSVTDLLNSLWAVHDPPEEDAVEADAAV